MIRLEEANQIIQNIKNAVSGFIMRIKGESITLSEINANIVNTPRYIQPMLEAVDPSFNFKDKIVFLKHVRNEFLLELNMHQNFLKLAQNFKTPVDTRQYSAELNYIASNFDKISVAEAKSGSQKVEEDRNVRMSVKKVE